MGFFRRGQPGREVEPDESARIEAGGIPSAAEARLKELAGEGGPFTSGLSVKELALLDRIGPRPLAQVMGASVVRVGWQYLPALDPGQVFPSGYGNQGSLNSSPAVYGRAARNRYGQPSLSQVRNYQWNTSVVCRLEMLSDAWNMARRRALGRLTEEATQVGADAVVGVHLRRSDHDLGEGTVEYVVSGTAIRLAGSGGQRQPVLSGLSVQDYWRLLRAGHEPRGLLATTTAVFASPPRSTQVRRVKTTAKNQELEEITSAFHLAREAVRTGLREQIGASQGDGAVGVELSHSVHRRTLEVASPLSSSTERGWHMSRVGVPYRVTGGGGIKREGWVITMHAAGTAVRRREAVSQEAVKTTMQARTK